jgi:hypothetical protein
MQGSEPGRWRIQALNQSAICIVEGAAAPEDAWVVPTDEAAVERAAADVEALMKGKSFVGAYVIVQTVLKALRAAGESQ